MYCGPNDAQYKHCDVEGRADGANDIEGHCVGGGTGDNVGGGVTGARVGGRTGDRVGAMTGNRVGGRVRGTTGANVGRGVTGDMVGATDGGLTGSSSLSLLASEGDMVGTKLGCTAGVVMVGLSLGMPS